MTAKKSKKVVKTKEQLVVDDLIVGENVKDLHGEDVEITDELIEKMEQFEQETKAHALWKNKVTGSFLFWNMPKVKKEAKKPGRKPKKVEEVEIEEEEDMEQAVEEVLEFDELEELEEEEDEADLLLDAKEDYATEYNIKGGAEKVNIGSKKFKAFFEKWKGSM